MYISVKNFFQGHMYTFWLKYYQKQPKVAIFDCIMVDFSRNLAKKV